jgi:hypothetical protein
MEGSIVLHRASRGVGVPLDCTDIAPDLDRRGRPAGWWLTFGARADRPEAMRVPAGMGLGAGVTALRIDGLKPAALLGVAVCQDDQLLWEMATHVGLAGHVSTAGEILDAMSLYRGGMGRGLWLDLTAGGAGRIDGLRVRLQVQIADPLLQPGAIEPAVAAPISVHAVLSAAARTLPR